MQSRRQLLICYGHDDMLLYTRKCILEQEFAVEICCNVVRLGEVLAQGPAVAVVVCHSVPQWECDEVIELSRAAWPGVKVLTLQESITGECSLYADRTMENLEGPPVLLRKVHSMLGVRAANAALA